MSKSDYTLKLGSFTYRIKDEQKISESQISKKKKN